MTEKPDNILINNPDSRLNLEDFAYFLPPELIATHPVERRDRSRLLHYCRENKISQHLQFNNIETLLKPGDILVVNNTRVIPARLIGKRANGGVVELLLIKKEVGQVGLWQAMAMPMKKLRVGDTIYLSGKNRDYAISVKEIVIAEDGQRRLLVSLADEAGKDLSFSILADIGNAPLPPYIVNARHNDFDQAEFQDLERYQTIFAREPGAVAAPTAGLHFSPDLLEALRSKDINTHEITLHVGPGTFKPITTGIEEHSVEAEWFSISPEVSDAINKAKKSGRRIIAVGTTTCRALESAYKEGSLIAQQGYTSLFIKPGYQFKLIDGLVTNFHLSKSSLLLLVAALVGRAELMKIYQEAIDLRYRFYSYGDAMIIL